MQQTHFESDSHLLSVFNKCSTVWNRDEFILWILCCAPDDKLGKRIRTLLVDETMKKKCGSQKLQEVVEESVLWIKSEKCKIPCRYFRFGACKYGDSCRYMHSGVVPKEKQKKKSVTKTDDSEKRCSIDMIGWNKKDPIRRYANEIGVTMHESDSRKTKICTFFQEEKCHKGAKCKFSHHPSFLWDEMIENVYPWVHCDVPKEMFGDVFLASGKLEKKFNVTIRVPRKETVQELKRLRFIGHEEKLSELTVKMQGSPENVRDCINAMSKMLHTKIFVLEGKIIVLDSDDDSCILSDLSNNLCDSIAWNTIGKESNDPVRLMCDKLKVTRTETNMDCKNKYKIHLCTFFYGSKCKNGNTCSYSHHPQMLWDFSPGQWNQKWATDECAFWALCYAPRNRVGNDFRRRLVEKLLDENEGSHIVDVVRAHVKWMNENNSKKDTSETPNTQCTVVEKGCQTDECPREMDFRDTLFYNFMQTPVAADKTIWEVLLQTPPQVFLQALVDARCRFVQEQTHHTSMFVQDQGTLFNGFFPMFVHESKPFAFGL